ncbi:enolase C-terminal domain-like protein [Cytophagaceae bacterium ABcell3]|nr:enolase C-terminal domain-like protein [Cytophagaceae bacterium ABcell3]
MLTWSAEKINLKLLYSWKISRNESSEKTNIIVTVSDGKIYGRGEAAPNIRYGESPEKLMEEFLQFQQNAPKAINSIEQLAVDLKLMNISNSLRFAIESAALHFESLSQGRPLETWGLRPASGIRTSYTLPIMDLGQVSRFIEEYKLSRFVPLKLKVNAENAEGLIKEVRRIYDGDICIDANEAWRNPDDVLRLMEKVKNSKILFFEQPFPHELVVEYKYLKKNSDFDIIADESITDKVEDIPGFSEMFHGINMKLMKAGGYLNGLKILDEANKHNMKTMVGCMIETTLGISSALNLASGLDYVDLDGFFVVGNEPFGLVKEEDGLLFKNDLKL